MAKVFHVFKNRNRSKKNQTNPKETNNQPKIKKPAQYPPASAPKIEKRNLTYIMNHTVNYSSPHKKTQTNQILSRSQWLKEPLDPS